MIIDSGNSVLMILMTSIYGTKLYIPALYRTLGNYHTANVQSLIIGVDLSIYISGDG